MLYFCWTVLILLMAIYVYVVYSVTLFIVVINLCIYLGLLQICGDSPPLCFFFFCFSFFFCLFVCFSFLFFKFKFFNFLNLLLFSLHLFLSFFFLLFFAPCNYSLLYINLHLPLSNFAYIFFIFFLSFPINILVSFIFIALCLSWHLALFLLSSLCFS